jgi:hypothetical protein
VGLARRLLPLLGPGMLVLLDRAFDAAAFFAEITATGAALLARAKSTRKPLVVQHLPDGSYLSSLDGNLAVRIIEAGVVMTGADGTRVADSYRLITTLTNHRRYPADALVRLYHERWEIEVGHRWHRSRRVAFSWLCSLFLDGLLVWLCPAGARVEAWRTGSAFA